MNARSLTGLVHRVVAVHRGRPTLKCDLLREPRLSWRFLHQTRDDVTCQLCGGQPAKPLSLDLAPADIQELGLAPRKVA